MEDESYVLVGTPLPKITKIDAFGDLKKPNPTRDLEVRDEQGRRRFHGAFTGGFSAGYYNTVGSKEGWAPSEFVSSRDKRSEKKVARPEDFMDEEDKQMLADSARLLATEDFDTIGSSQRDLVKKRAAAKDMQASGGALGVLSDRMIDDLIVPSSEPVGIRLLKRMGWKPGQGIGPRVSRRQRKAEEPLSDDDADLPANISFAPIDSAIVVFTNKANHQGLGFDPYKNAPEFDRSFQEPAESKYLSEHPKGKKTGFGFGSFDDDDEDDFYGSGPTIMRTLDTDMDLDDRPGVQRKEGRRKSEPSSDMLPSILCSDGRPPLHGFVLAATASQPFKWYSAPKVPHDFVPHHIFPDSVKPAMQTNRREQSKLTADDRALVLGETLIDAPRRSVFEYMSAENKNRLDNILGFVMDTEGEKRVRKDHWEAPKMEKASAAAALQGFIPFGDNIAKQSRYKQYLNIQAGISDETIELVEGFSGEDMTKELSEFVQAARIFKPLSSSLASQFTTATKVIEFAQPAAGLRTAEDIRAAEKSSPSQPAIERMEIPKSQAAKAASMGVFGPLTRTTVDFLPSKLLCKRFNVPNPHPEHKGQGPETAKDLLDKDTMARMMMNRAPGDGMSDKDGLPQGSSVNSEVVALEVGVQEEGPAEEQPEEVQERPPMDIFKAIFDDSDSDSNSDNDEAEENTTVGAAESREGGVKSNDEEQGPQPGPEPESQGPFRPMFTRKTDRSGAESSMSMGRAWSRSSKLEFAHLSEDEEEDENEIGPKLAIPKPKSSAAKRVSAGATKQNVDDANENENKSPAVLLLMESGPISHGDRRLVPDEIVNPQEPSPGSISVPKERNLEDETTSPSSPRNDDKHSSKRHKSSTSSHRSSLHNNSPSYEESSSANRHNSSSSRSEKTGDRHSSSSRHRSTSKSRRRKSKPQDESEEDSDGGHDLSDTPIKESKNRKHHSESSSSRSKSKRHKEYRSKSRSRSPSGRSHRKDRGKESDRHRDRDRNKDRSDKRSRSDKHKSRRDRDRGDQGEPDMEGLWVEKKTDAPVIEFSEPAPPPPRPVHRTRASDFF